jgi:hypothetical protein
MRAHAPPSSIRAARPQMGTIEQRIATRASAP